MWASKSRTTVAWSCAVWFASVGTSHARPTAPLHEYLSRPDILVPRLFVDSYNESAAAPGYIFLSPYYPELNPWRPDASDFEHTVNFHAGPMMYDNQGDLVWAGLNLTGHDEPPMLVFGTMGFERCDYGGSPHLCTVHWHPDSRIHHDVLDEHYQTIKTIETTPSFNGTKLTNDTHEFHIVDRPTTDHRPTSQATAIITGNADHHLPQAYTLPQCGFPINWVMSSVFQERDLQTNEILFEWDSLNHIPLEESHCGGNDGFFRSGAGRAVGFDHLHLNSIDKDERGDYYLSGRHTSTIYKISGQNGTILWRFGEHGTFAKHSEVPGIAPNFGYQHHLRLQPDYPGHNISEGRIVVSIFDNANDHYDFVGKTADFSSGKIFLIDERNQSATLKEAYTLLLNPKHQLATNQGSFQLLPNGNRLLGGGNIQEIIEWQPGNFEPVFRAHFGDWELANGQVGHKINSYRTFRFEWQGAPLDRPRVFTFAEQCEAAQTSYVSWNGATEVASWAIYGGVASTGPFQLLESGNRTGFESRVETPFANYIVAAALDHAGQELGRSSPTLVSVPTDRARRWCQPDRCAPGFDYKVNAARICPPAKSFATEASTASSQETLADIDEGHCDPCFDAFGNLPA